MYKTSFSKQIPVMRVLRTCRHWLPLALLGALFAAPAQAQKDDDALVREFEFTPFAGVSGGGDFTDPNDGDDRDLDSSASFGLIVSFTADEPTRHYELLYSNQGTDIEGDTDLDLDVQYLHIGGAIDFPPDSRRAIPFVAGGLGATLLSPDRSGLDDETKFSLSIGGGLKIPFNDRVALRLDARAFITFIDSDTSVFCVSNPPNASCDIAASNSDTFIQFQAAIGITAGF